MKEVIIKSYFFTYYCNKKCLMKDSTEFWSISLKIWFAILKKSKEIGSSNWYQKSFWIQLIYVLLLTDWFGVNFHKGKQKIDKILDFFKKFICLDQPLQSHNWVCIQSAVHLHTWGPYLCSHMKGLSPASYTQWLTIDFLF